MPIGHWFRGELSGYADQVIREARTEEWLDKRAVIDVLRRFRAGDADVPWRQVWTLVVFSLWHQIYVERVFDPVALGWQTGRAAPRGIAPAAVNHGPLSAPVRVARRRGSRWRPAAAAPRRRAARGSCGGRGAAGT